MRVVLDTNVLVSGIFWSGPPARVLELWARGRFTLCVSAPILEEYFEVIDRLAVKCGHRELARRWKTYLFEYSELTAPTCRFTACRDPDDAMFVACALSTSAQFLVSGDDDLLVLGCVETTRILNPSRFLKSIDT